MSGLLGDEAGELAPDSSRAPAGTRCANRSVIKEYAKNAGFFDGKADNAKRAVLSSLITDLEGKGYACRWNDLVWLV